MRIKRNRDVTSRWVLFAGSFFAAGAMLSWAAADPPSARPDSPPPLDIEDQILPVGKECIVMLAHGDSQTEVSGRLEQINNRWLNVHVAKEARSEGVPMLNKVPYTNRLFRNVGIVRTYEDYWIPRERVLHVRVANNSPSLDQTQSAKHAAEPPPAE